ncbi:RNA-directed DNA polymerase from mobile element jockey-like, partial [Paramuricea clavata]
MEGIKLDMTILESRMLAAMSENQHESDIISLRVKLVDMEAVVHNEDEIISRLSEENLSFRSSLLNLEKLVHFMSQEYRNKSSGAINLSNITKEPSTRNRKQSINLNKNSLSSPRNIDNNLPHDNQQHVSPSVSNIDFTADVPQPNSQTKQKVDLTADDRMADESQPNPLIKQKVDLTTDEPLPNPLIAQNKEINLLKNGNSNSKTKFNRVSNEDKNKKYVNSPKSSIPCPFLSRRGWCAKGNRCDFQHKEPGRDKHKISCPFLRRNGFCLIIRPILEYCAPVFHYSIPSFLSEDLETLQKRALKIILPANSYSETLEYFNLQTLFQRREEMCNKLFTNTTNNPTNKLHNLLPPKHES